MYQHPAIRRSPRITGASRAEFPDVDFGSDLLQLDARLTALATRTTSSRNSSGTASALCAPSPAAPRSRIY